MSHVVALAAVAVLLGNGEIAAAATDRVLSISMISVLPKEEKKRAWQRIGDVFTQHPSLASQTE